VVILGGISVKVEMVGVLLFERKTWMAGSID
jgi:hypothetical protein